MKFLILTIQMLNAVEKIRSMPRYWKKGSQVLPFFGVYNFDHILGLNEPVEIKGHMVESKDYLGQCSIDLPLNSNQAATYFEWKLKVTKIGSKKEKRTQRTYDRQRRVNVDVESTVRVENEIKFGIKNPNQYVFISSKSGEIINGLNLKYHKEQKYLTVTESDILLFQFDCITGTLFMRKNDEPRTLLGYVNDLKSPQTSPFYPWVKFEGKGDKIEILSAGPVHNSIHSTPIVVSKSSNSNQASVWFMLFAVCIACYSKYMYKK